MTTEEYKAIFKNFVKRAQLSGTAQRLIRGNDYDEILEYLNGTKDINGVTDLGELYGIRAKFFMLDTQCKMISKYIEELQLNFTGNFSDTEMSLEEIGMNTGDEFVCKKPLFHWEMVQINEGSRIEILEFNHAGSKSTFTCKFIELLTDENTRRNFPNDKKIDLLLTFDELKNHFDRVE